MAQRSHLVLFGGFLGAGKTSAMIAFGEWLAEQGIRAGFITNDQGADLVDTRLLQFCGMTTEEVAGGCFCCRFDELVGATRRLRGVHPPDVFVAEAVGSCTDLAATVMYPMRRMFGAECTVAPLSVLVDPVRARRTLGLDAGEQFSDTVQYIFTKQLEEAEFIVITKRELLDRAAIDELRGALRHQYPRAIVFAISAQEGIGTDEWFKRVTFGQQQARELMDVDYDRYAEGEARLGWLNARVEMTSDSPRDGNALLHELAAGLHQQLRAQPTEVAHLKMTLESGDGIAAMSLVRNDFVPEERFRLKESITAGTLTMNLRAEAAPELLERLVRESLEARSEWKLDVMQLQAFRPGRPVPKHRDWA